MLLWKNAIFLTSCPPALYVKQNVYRRAHTYDVYWLLVDQLILILYDVLWCGVLLLSIDNIRETVSVIWDWIPLASTLHILHTAVANRLWMWILHFTLFFQCWSTHNDSNLSFRMFKCCRYFLKLHSSFQSTCFLFAVLFSKLYHQ